MRKGRRRRRAVASRLLFALVLPCLLVAPGVALGQPDSPVAAAAQRGDLDAVRRLLRDGADVNAAQGDGMTALHWAAERGDEVLGEVLIYAGARMDAGTRIGHYTPLHLAARGAHAPVVTLLLEAGSDPAARTSNSGASPLHLAAAASDPRVVSELIDWGADVNAREAAWGQTPLIFAAANNRVAVIRALLQAGADPSLTAHSVDVEEQAKADGAAERRLGEFLAAFKEKEGGGTEWQPTPSQVQAAIEASREIQRRWPDVPDPADDDRESEDEAPDSATVAADTTLAAEAEAGTAEAADTVATVAAEAADTVAADSAAPDTAAAAPQPMSYAQQVGSWGGLTALLHAVRQGHADAAAALLDGGADINQPSGGDATTPLLMAAVNGQFDLALELLDRGADPNLVSRAGTTPLFAVIERQWAPRASYAHPTEHEQQQATHLDVLEALLTAGADPNVRLNSHLWYMEYTFGVLRGSGINLKGATPFWRAAYALDVDAMRILKDHGADPHIPTMKPPQRRRRPPATEPAEKQEAEKEGEQKVTEGDAEIAVGDEKVAAGDEKLAETAGAEEGKAAPTKGNAEGESSEEATEQPAGQGEEEDEDFSGVPTVPVGGAHIFPIHAASGVGYGQSFAGNAHRHVPDNWLAAIRFLVEECEADVNVRDANAYTALHHAASRGDNELILFLLDHGADVTVLSRKGQTTADMANGPIQRLQPFPATIVLLEELGSKNNHKCLSCQ